MSVQQQPIFPVTLEDLRQNPAIKEHWPHVSRLMLGYLLTTLHKSSTGARCSEQAQAEIAICRSLGMLIDQLLTLGDAAPARPAQAMKPLHRFQGDPDSGKQAG